jgi:hypothetical protein
MGQSPMRATADGGGVPVEARFVDPLRYSVPKCRGSQEYRPFFDNLALPPVLVEIPGARGA